MPSADLPSRSVPRARLSPEDWRADVEAKWCGVGADDCERFLSSLPQFR
jgi:hypothetical protein